MLTRSTSLGEENFRTKDTTQSKRALKKDNFS